VDARLGWTLVVSGDAGRRMTLFRLLERRGQRATVANDEHAALAMLLEDDYDLVLVDASSPGVDGDELLAAVRREPRLCRIPVLMADAEWEEACGQADR
jgi:CheY-like chemotaxis protein